MKINGMESKTVLSMIGIGVLILSSLVGYIYAEASASRTRDTDIMAYVVEKDIEQTKISNNRQEKQMALLNDINIKVTVVQKDIEHIKKNGGNNG